MKSIRRILFPFVLIALFLLFLGYGTIYLSPGDICTDIINFVLGETPVDPVKSDLLRYIRLPHAVLAFIIGGGLAVTGAVMQGVMRNPLADPYLWEFLPVPAWVLYWLLPVEFLPYLGCQESGLLLF